LLFRVPKVFRASSPDVGESGESYVLRDFERSRIAAIRDAIAEAPALATLFYVMAVALWTGLLSAGAGLHGDPRLAVNLTPHVAHYTIILGFFLYPLRLIWIPFLVYLGTFLYPFYQPFSVAVSWHDLPGMTPGLVIELFVIHLIGGLLTGLMYRMVYAAGRGLMRPHSLDLFTSFSGYFIFAVLCLLQLAVMLRLAEGLPDELREAYGFTDDYTQLAIKRILRGSVVVSVFLLAAVESPRPGQFLRTLLLALVFPLLVPLQAMGLGLYPQIDVVVLGLIVVLTNPVGVGVHACIFGVAAYAALTGEFLDDTVVISPAESMLSAYSLVGLTLVTFAMMLKGQSDHLITEKDGAILKLDRARDFAGVGLFAVNHDTGRFRLDEAAQRMLGLPSDGPISVLEATFMPADGAALSATLSAGRGQGRALELHMASAAGTANVLRCYLWAERTPSGETAAYGILLDMTEAEDRETRLRDALDQLSRREEKQRQLFSIISHELRTPASVISLLTDELGDGTDGARLHRKFREATDQLLSVLDDMRQAVNPEKNLPVKLVPYVPADLAESIRAANEAPARAKGIAIGLDLGAGAAQARIGDVIRVRQALNNLVRNATIHSGGRSITIRWCAAEPMADFMPTTEWQIVDDGVGIPDTDVARLFEPFERGGADPRKTPDGSGLGLYIARGSIQMLGGTLDHFRPAEGGAGYVIRLPEAIASDTQLKAATADLTASQAQIAQNRDWSVLLAEDNVLVAEITRARLEKINAVVHHAADGRAALQLALAIQPDVIITDLFMPEMDGDDLIRALREAGLQRPVVGVTAAVVGEEMDRFRRAGANVVMRKPLDFEQLRGYLRDGFPAPQPSED
jgi:signal transduction histidine kinase